MRAVASFALLFAAPVALCELTGFAPKNLQLERAIFSAAPLALNTSQYQFVLDPTIKIVGDWDVRLRRDVARAHAAFGGAAARGRVREP